MRGGKSLVATLLHWRSQNKRDQSASLSRQPSRQAKQVHVWYTASPHKLNEFAVLRASLLTIIYVLLLAPRWLWGASPLTVASATPIGLLERKRLSKGYIYREASPLGTQCLCFLCVCIIFSYIKHDFSLYPHHRSDPPYVPIFWTDLYIYIIWHGNEFQIQKSAEISIPVAIACPTKMWYLLKIAY